MPPPFAPSRRSIFPEPATNGQTCSVVGASRDTKASSRRRCGAPGVSRRSPGRTRGTAQPPSPLARQGHRGEIRPLCACSSHASMASHGRRAQAAKPAERHDVALGPQGGGPAQRSVAAADRVSEQRTLGVLRGGSARGGAQQRLVRAHRQRSQGDRPERGNSGTRQTQERDSQGTHAIDSRSKCTYMRTRKTVASDPAVRTRPISGARRRPYRRRQEGRSDGGLAARYICHHLPGGSRLADQGRRGTWRPGTASLSARCR